MIFFRFAQHKSRENGRTIGGQLKRDEGWVSFKRRRGTSLPEGGLAIRKKKKKLRRGLPLVRKEPREVGFFWFEKKAKLGGHFRENRESEERNRDLKKGQEKKKGW